MGVLMPRKPAWKKIRVPASGGLDTKTDPKQVSIERNIEVKNGEFGTLGQVIKRNGFRQEAITETIDGADIIQAGSVCTRETLAGASGDVRRTDGEIIISAEQASAAGPTFETVDGWHLYSHIYGEGQIRSLGPFEPLELDVEPITVPKLATDVPEVMPDVAYNNGYICMVWADEIGRDCTAVTIIDAETGGIVVDRHRISYVSYVPESPHVVAVGDSFHIYDVINTFNNFELGQAIIDTAAITTVPANYTAVRVDVHNDKLYDVTVSQHTVQGFCSVVAYKDAFGSVRIVQYDEAGALVINLPDAAALPINAISVQRVYDATTVNWRVIVTRQEQTTNDIEYKIYSENIVLISANRLLIPYGPTIVAKQITCIHADGWKNAGSHANSTIHWYVEVENDALPAVWASGTPFFYYVDQAYDQFGVAAAVLLPPIRNCNLWSKAFTYDGRARVWTTYDSPEQSSYFLQSSRNNDTGLSAVLGSRTDAKILYTRGCGARTNHGLGHCTEMASNVWIWPLLRAERTTRMENIGDHIYRSVGYGTVRTPDAGVKRGLQHAQLGPTRTVAMGGQLVDCSGEAIDLGFFLYPEPIGIYETPGGPHDTGDFMEYAVIYEHTDYEGQVHRSAPGLNSYTVVAMGQAVRVVVPYLHKGDAQKLVGTGDTILEYTLLAKIFRRASDGVYHLIYAIPNADSAAYFSFDDTYADALILDNEVLYTSGGVLANIGPPATRIVAADSKRMCIVPEDDRTSVWVSKEKEYGQAISFSDLLTMRVLSGGQITAVASMDGKWILFQEAQISMFYGEGPNALGNGTFSPIQPIVTDVGCIDRRSVVMTPQGLFFKSKKGFFQLDRGLQVTYKGAPAEHANQYDVYDGRLVENKTQVRWVLSSGEMLVYDYFADRWAVHVLRYLSGSCTEADTNSIVDAASWRGNYALLRDNGYFYWAEPSTAFLYVDDVCGYPLDVSTAWIKMDGLMGWQRFRRVGFVGDFHGECTLTVEIYYDFDESTVHQTVTYEVTAAVLAAGAPDIFRFRLDRQKCQAMKIRIYDSNWSGAVIGYEAYSLSGWEIELGMKPSMVKANMDRTLG